MIGVATLLLGICIVAAPGLEVRAVTTINQIGSDISGETADDQSGYSVAMSADGNRIAIGAPYNDDSGVDSGQVRIHTWNGTTWTQTGADIDGETAGDQSGYSVAMSADGNRIAIGARYNDDSSDNSGHVRIYTWNGTTWTQTGADINGEAEEDYSGWSVAMSADGNRIAIGAVINNNRTGHVRIYTWDGTNWTQTGADINGEADDDSSGSSVAMSADGTRIAIGAPGNDGSGSGTGHVRIYTWDGTNWTQTGADINGEADGEYSGSSVAMSADGTRIAIGATGNNDNGSNAGQVLIYTWDGTTWTQTGANINGETANDYSGYSVAMSADGTRIAIGAIWNDDGGVDSGHVRIYSVPAAPAPPTISSVTAANGSLTVAFTAGTDGGSPITNYKYSIDGTNYVALNPAATTSPFTINGLTNGTSYSVSIKAVNEIGDSVASNAVAGIPVAPIATTTTTVAPTATATVPVLETVKKAGSLPKTGDNSSMVVMIGLVFTMTGLVLTSRRRIKQQAIVRVSGM